MDEVTFAVVGAGFMGGVLARVGRELPYSRVWIEDDEKTAKNSAFHRNVNIHLLF